MVKVIDKIKNWIKKIFGIEKVELIESAGEEVISNDDSILEIQFKNSLRIEPSDEEISLIRKFQNGEISFTDLTEEMRSKIINGYNLLTNKNINIIENNMRKVESAQQQ